MRLEVRDDGERDETGQLVDPTYIEQEVPVTVRVSVSEDGDPVKDLAPFETVAGDGGIDVDADPTCRRRLLRPRAPARAVPCELGRPDPAARRGRRTGRVPARRAAARRLGRPRADRHRRDARPIRDRRRSSRASPTSEGADRTVRGLGSGILAVGGDAILGVEIRADRDQGNPPRIDEGGRAEFTGRVENLSLTDTIDLAPLRAISLGQGTVLGPVELTEDFPQPGEFGFFEPDARTRRGRDLPGRGRHARAARGRLGAAVGPRVGDPRPGAAGHDHRPRRQRTRPGPRGRRRTRRGQRTLDQRRARRGRPEARPATADRRRRDRLGALRRAAPRPSCGPEGTSSRASRA